MCLNLFSDLEADQEQMGPIPSANGGLDRALSNAHRKLIPLYIGLSLDTRYMCT